MKTHWELWEWVPALLQSAEEINNTVLFLTEENEYEIVNKKKNKHKCMLTLSTNT